MLLASHKTYYNISHYALAYVLDRRALNLHGHERGIGVDHEGAIGVVATSDEF